MVFLNRGAVAIDTSNNFYVGDCDVRECEEYPRQEFIFKDFTDVQMYWSELKHICLRTSYRKHMSEYACFLSEYAMKISYSRHYLWLVN